MLIQIEQSGSKAASSGVLMLRRLSESKGIFNKQARANCKSKDKLINGSSKLKVINFTPSLQHRRKVSKSGKGIWMKEPRIFLVNVKNDLLLKCRENRVKEMQKGISVTGTFVIHFTCREIQVREFLLCRNHCFMLANCCVGLLPMCLGAFSENGGKLIKMKQTRLV